MLLRQMYTETVLRKGRNLKTNHYGEVYALKCAFWPGMATHPCNLSTWEAKAGGFQGILGHLGLYH